MAKQVLLISANGGVGSVVARTLLANGDVVTATVSRAEKLAAFERDIPGCRQVIPLDLSQAEQVRETLDGLIAGMDSLDAVIVCGATSPFAPTEMTSFAMFRRTMEVNCVSHLAIYQAALPALRRSTGRMVFISSLSGRVATPMMGAYCSSKFALEGLADAMRQEASEWGIHVILLQPGNIDTPIIPAARETLAAMIPALPDKEQELYGKLYRQMQYRVNSTLDAGGIMSPQKVADAAMQALAADPPQTRYQVGADAEMLVEMSRTRPDREIDALVLDIYRSAPV